MESEAERTVLAEGRHLRLVRQGRWEYADRIRARGAVVIVAVTPDRRLLLTEQFRVPVGKRVIELPAGLVGDIEGEEEEELATAAARELLEETGYQPTKLEMLTQGPPSAGMISEMVAFFLASDLVKMHEGGGDESEDIVVHAIPLDDAERWLQEQFAGEMLIDPKVYVGLYFAGRA